MAKKKHQAIVLGASLSAAEVRATEIRLETEIRRVEKEITELLANPPTPKGQEGDIMINV